MNSTIATLENFALGLARDGTVVLKPHNPLWEEAAAFEIDRLSKGIRNSKFSFHHIGSTSIATICAKPILDLLLVAPSLMEIDQCKEEFEILGYECKGAYGIPGRRYCVLYNENRTRGYVHVHGFAANHVEVDRHLLFRDYLRAHPEVAWHYQQLKLTLISDEKLKRANYTEAKAPFIENALSKAQEWRKSN